MQPHQNSSTGHFHPIWLQSLLIVSGLLALITWPLHTTFLELSMGWAWVILAVLASLGLVHQGSIRLMWQTLGVANALWLLAWLAFQLAVFAHPDISWTDQMPYALVLKIPFQHLLWGWGLWGALFLLMPSRMRGHAVPKALVSKGRYLPWIGMAFVVSLLVSNITTQKISHFWGITVDVGTWFFPVTYIFNDIFTEVYGYSATRKYIWAAIFANLVMIGGFALVLHLGHSPFKSSYTEILWTVPRILLASLVAFFLGEFLNAFVLAKLKIKMRGRWLPLRTIGSTGVGVAIDSIAFVTIAFAGTMPVSVLLAIALWEYILKVGYEILATPLTCYVIKVLKKVEHQDIYDVKTRFSPFHWR